ncbi:MAG: aromatic amino acid transport family protein [Gammaproteobacteria bacterium]|jgi:tyrosine-specific transport protein
MLKNINYFKGVCLITGTCIGAGMIGVPVKTAAAGFYPTIAAFGVVWLVMTCSALLLLEVSLAFSGDINFISMTNTILGKTGRNIAWVIYLLFMYSIMAAYAAGGAALVAKLGAYDPKMATLIFMLPFALIIYLGTTWVAIVNRILTTGIIIFFILLCFSIFGTTRTLQPIENLYIKSDLKVLFMALPVLVTTFSYHEIIPSLKSYLKEKLIPLKLAILLGGFIPLIIYIAWELVILLLVPVFGGNGLISMLSSNKNPSDSLINYLLEYNNKGNILFFISSFLFCALTCSLTGTAWALFDFFADGLAILKNKQGKLILSSLTFIPPIIYAIVFPQGFLKALGLAGAFSAILMIIYPALMAYKLRASRHLVANSPIIYRAPIGKILISIIFLFGVLILILEGMAGVSNFGYLH